MTVATSPAVVFGEGRRPETATHVTLPAFDGPLALLLSLIEARQLDVLTVPLGALADAYLDALATLDDDRMGNVSAFVTVASQLILIKIRAMLPRRPADGAVTPARRGPGPRGGASRPADPVPRLPRRGHPAARRTPRARWACSTARRRPHAPPASRGPDRRPPSRRSTRAPRRRRSTRWPGRPAAAAAARDDPAHVTLDRAGGDHPRGARGRARGRAPGPAAGVRDRVVVAVTFLAMLELVKGREIVVEQDEPWGPIVARRTTPAERPRPASTRPTRRRRSTSRWSRSRDRAGRPAPSDAPERASRPSRGGRHPASSPRRTRGTAVRGGAAAVAARDRARSPGSTRRRVDARLGDLEVALARARHPARRSRATRVELATAPEAGALIARYVGADAVRLSPAALETLAIVAYRQPVTRAASSASAASTPTTPSARCSTAGSSSSRGGPTRPAGRSCTGPASSSSSGSGSRRLDELPPLDARGRGPAGRTRRTPSGGGRRSTADARDPTTGRADGR